jgi:hypothetical protein
VVLSIGYVESICANASEKTYRLYDPTFFLFQNIYKNLSQNKRDILEKCIATAKYRKLGIWSMSERISAAEHKKLQKENHPLQETTNSKAHGNGGSGSGKNFISKSHPSKKKESASIENRRSSRKKSNLLEVAITGLELVA